jgi:hypothetical protein
VCAAPSHTHLKFTTRVHVSSSRETKIRLHEYKNKSKRHAQGHHACVAPSAIFSRVPNQDCYVSRLLPVSNNSSSPSLFNFMNACARLNYKAYDAYVRCAFLATSKIPLEQLNVSPLCMKEKLHVWPRFARRTSIRPKEVRTTGMAALCLLARFKVLSQHFVCFFDDYSRKRPFIAALLSSARAFV